MLKAFFIVATLYLFNIECTETSNVRERNDDPDICHKILGNFSDSVADFMKCSIHNARPISLCGNCINNYIDLIEYYAVFKKSEYNGTRCIMNFENMDRLQVVRIVFSSILDLWSRANCDDCFMFVNGNITNTTSLAVEKFHDLFNNYNVCAETNNNSYTNDTVYCQNCEKLYHAVNDYYIEVGRERGGILQVCMDIVDKMNKSQLEWSNHCCKYRKHDEYIYLFITIIMCLLPMIFYVSTKLLSEEINLTILRQNRLSENINTPSTSLPR